MTTRRLTLGILLLQICMLAYAQWPAQYGGVMLQAFSWNSYSDTQWTTLEAQAGELAQSFDLVWIPNAANCGSGQQMGYAPVYWFANYDSSFGNKNQLLSMVNAFNNHNVGVIGDVVINHRMSVEGWTGFATGDRYNNVDYSMSASDITSNDDGGKTAQHVPSGQHLGNADTGTDWDGMRDLDHTSTHVQNAVKAYLGMLINDFHYAGYRYDMVLGYAPSYTALYNTAVPPQFSIGECWEKDSTIKNWIDGTKVNGTPTSAAFDFPFRYAVRNAIRDNDWRKLGQSVSDGNYGYPLVSSSFNSGTYRRWAVTFVENHDTQDRRPVGGSQQDPLAGNILAANAFLLAMPGTPCVFLEHWKAYPHEIAAMIAARKIAGVHNESAYTQRTSTAEKYAVSTTGTNGTLWASVGNVASEGPPTDFTQILEGDNYRYYLSNSVRKAWADKPSGTYYEPIDVKLIAVTSATGAQVVYTTDGSNPTASSTAVASGTTIRLTGNTTLKAAILANGSITANSTITREYTITAPPQQVTIYFAKPDDWQSVYYYTYGATDINTPTPGWPGMPIYDTKNVKGREFYYATYTITGDNPSFTLIVNWGNSDNQTHNYPINKNTHDLSKDIFLELSNKTDGKWNMTDISADYNLPYTATVYLQDPGWDAVKYYAWDSNGELLGNWSGTTINATTTINGKNYFYHPFTINALDYTFQMVFNDGNGTQSLDTPPINTDVYFKIGALNETEGKYELVAIDPMAADVDINPKNLNLEVDQTYTLQVTSNGHPASGVRYASSNASVATVSNAGVVTAKMAGTAQITATVNGVSATCNVTVTPAHFTVYVSLGNNIPAGEDWSQVCLYAWKHTGSATVNYTSWPGDEMTETVVYNGATYYYKEFEKPSSDYQIKVVVNNNNKGKQSKDSEAISSDTYITLGTWDNSNGKYNLSLSPYSEADITKTLAALVSNGSVGSTYIISDGDLRAVRLSADGSTLYCKDDDGYGAPSIIAAGQIDYIKDVEQLMTDDMDQSNWIALELNAEQAAAAPALVGHRLQGVKGVLQNLLNPTFIPEGIPQSYDSGEPATYEPNCYIPASFAGQVQQGQSTGRNFFFVTPKPMEIAAITLAMWDGEAFVSMPAIDGYNSEGLGGGFGCDMSLCEDEDVPEFTTNYVYSFTGLISKNGGAGAPAHRAPATSGFTVAPLSDVTAIARIDGGTVTGVSDIGRGNLVVTARYNVMGQPVSSNAAGIIILKMSDGTTRKVFIAPK